VVQRLSDFRVPVRSIVTFTFERKVRIGPDPETEAEAETEERVNESVPAESRESKETIPSARPPLQTRLSITFQESSDAEEAEEKEGDTDGHSFESKTEREEVPRSDVESAAAPRSVPVSPRAMISQAVPVTAQQGSDDNKAKREVAALQQEIDRLRSDLMTVSEQRDSLRDELDDLRMKLEMTVGERNEFLRQVCCASPPSPPWSHSTLQPVLPSVERRRAGMPGAGET
jgi:hypothetical protein